MKMDMPDRIVAARKTLGLGEKASLKEVKEAYRNLAKQHHPDKSGSGGEEHMAKISDAHKVLIDYLEAYKYSFKLDDILEQNPQWRWERNYAEDPLWGAGKTKRN